MEADGEKLARFGIRGADPAGSDVFLATLIPRDELLGDVDRVRNQSVLIALALLIVASGIVLWSLATFRVAAGSRTRGEQIRRFRLSRPMRVRSRIAEVDDLADTMAVMKHSLQQFFAISKALSAEKDYKKLLEMIIREARSIAHADGGAILMVSDDESALEAAIIENEATGLHYGGTSGVEAPFDPIASKTPLPSMRKLREGVKHIRWPIWGAIKPSMSLRCVRGTGGEGRRKNLCFRYRSPIRKTKSSASSSSSTPARQRVRLWLLIPRSYPRSKRLRRCRGCARSPADAAGAEGSARCDHPHGGGGDRCQVAIHPRSLPTRAGNRKGAGSGSPRNGRRAVRRLQTHR